MPCPQDHETYHSRAEADATLERDIARHKRTGKGGKSWKRLCVFPCRNHFHIGRANTMPKTYRPPAPETKPPTAAELRRKLKRDANAGERQRAHILKTIDAYGDVADLADSINIAPRMVERYFRGLQ